MAKRIIPLYVGQSFGRLTILAFAGRRSNNLQWLCRCDCGAERVFSQSALRKGAAQSCGCRHKEIMSTHRRSHTTEWRAWRDMLGRCRNPTHASYANYGGRGIAVCPEWYDFSRFFEDVGLRPTGRYSLERLNNNLGYFPANVVWATQEQQMNNTRQNVVISVFGDPMTLTEAARHHDVPTTTLKGRLERGVPPEVAVSATPPTGRPRSPVPTGQTFGRLTVLGFAGLSQDSHSLWKCQCICGKTTVVYARSIRRGATKSCGCLRGHHATTRRSTTT